MDDFGYSYGRKKNDDPNDPHNLKRYAETHGYYPGALREIQQGQKSSCWMWYIFPTPPWIVNGQERGSGTNAYYSLRTDEQAKAYLEWNRDGVNFRKDLLEITAASRDQLKGGRNVWKLMGVADAPKFKSSMEYFHKIAKDMGDKELEDLCGEVVEILGSPENSKKPTYSWSWKKTPSSSSSSSEEEADAVAETQPTQEATQGELPSSPQPESESGEPAAPLPEEN